MTDLSSTGSRYAVLRPETLGAMAVLQSISFEDILAARMARFREVWASHDPPNAAQYDVDVLEFDPIKIIEENNAYFEMLVRDRVNQAARAVTLAFGFGTNLDAIATRYPGGVPRLVGENDDRYRRRIWSSPNPLSPHGTAEAYEFWALSALATLRDARTTKIRPSLADNPIIVIACLLDSAGTWRQTTGINSLVAIRESEPAPSQSDLVTVRAYIQDEHRLAMTDEISVAAPKVIETEYRVQIDLFPGIIAADAMQQVMNALQALIEKQRWLGYDHILASISDVSMVSGVHNVKIILPATDTVVPNDWFVRVDKITVEYAGVAE